MGSAAPVPRFADCQSSNASIYMMRLQQLSSGAMPSIPNQVVCPIDMPKIGVSEVPQTRTNLPVCKDSFDRIFITTSTSCPPETRQLMYAATSDPFNPTSVFDSLVALGESGFPLFDQQGSEVAVGKLILNAAGEPTFTIATNSTFVVHPRAKTALDAGITLTDWELTSKGLILRQRIGDIGIKITIGWIYNQFFLDLEVLLFRREKSGVECQLELVKVHLLSEVFPQPTTGDCDEPESDINSVLSEVFPQHTTGDCDESESDINSVLSEVLMEAEDRDESESETNSVLSEVVPDHIESILSKMVPHNAVEVDQPLQSKAQLLLPN